MLEELREAASIYISRYMNTRTHAGTDYNILRMYEAWCFKTRQVPSTGGISYIIDNESIKGRFITEMTLMAGKTHHNKHRLSLINMRRHAQPALDHLAAFQVWGCHAVPRHCWRNHRCATRSAGPAGHWLLAGHAGHWLLAAWLPAC